MKTAEEIQNEIANEYGFEDVSTFTAYIEHRLIPDLKEAGSVNLAKDFECAKRIMESY